MSHISIRFQHAVRNICVRDSVLLKNKWNYNVSKPFRKKESPSLGPFVFLPLCFCHLLTHVRYNKEAVFAGGGKEENSPHMHFIIEQFLLSFS